MNAPKMKALPPATDPSVTDGLDMAMEGVSLAIHKMLDRRGDNHRFKEILRLATIGQAIGRQKARASKRVRDFVGPHEGMGRRRYNYACGPNPYGNLGGEDMAAVDMLANEPDEDDEENAADVGMGVGRGAFVNPIPPAPGVIGRGRRWIGAPYGVAEGNGEDPVQEGLARGAQLFGPVFEEMARNNDRRAETEERETDSQVRLDRARELEALTESLDRLPEAAREGVQRRIDAIVAELAQPEPEPPPPPEERAEKIDVTPCGDVPVPPEPRVLQIRCEACGNIHGRHWVTEAGIPRDCAVCGARTTLEQAQPAAAGAA